MANIVVTIHNAHTIKVDFGDYYPTSWPKKVGYYNRSSIELVENNGDYVLVHLQSVDQDWYLSYQNTVGAFTIDSVAGSSPTDNDDLAEMIADLAVA